MLKIKDDVNLKELEKFGMVFKPDRYKERECYVLYTHGMYDNAYIRLSINTLSRQIRLSCSEEAVNLLFDLITASLVEKE